MSLRIALVTCSAGPGLDPDEETVAAELAARGATAEIVAWDAEIDWSDFDLAVIRSAWDYHERPADFLAWTERAAAATRLANPPAVVRANHDKRYLRRLSGAGVPVVPTHYAAPGEQLILGRDDAAEEYVVKPTVSAGSRDTFRCTESAIAEHIAHIHASDRTAMIQPYVASVDEQGETGLVYLGGTFSHAFAKGAMLRPGATLIDGLYLDETIAPAVATDDQRAVGDDVLAALPQALDVDPADLLYARIDLVTGPEGTPWLMELEVIEPSLFLHTAPASAARFARAILDAASG